MDLSKQSDLLDVLKSHLPFQVNLSQKSALLDVLASYKELLHPPFQLIFNLWYVLADSFSLIYINLSFRSSLHQSHAHRMLL